MKRKILVVEDSPTQAERIRLLLEAEGYRVDVATNGLAGLKSVHAVPPDLIISDVVMPEMDGYELCQAVKTNEKSRRIPFVLLTERKTPLDILKGLEHGADNFITKPFEDDYLLERIRRIFEHLEFRKKGQLDVEVAIRASGREIVISPDKQQIIELLFASFEEICALNAQLAESKQQLEEASRHKSEFLNHMSHELRTPLNSVIGFAEILRDPAFGSLTEQQARFAHNILTAGSHLLMLVNDLLDLSRVEAGKLDFRPEPVDLRDALWAVVTELQPQADQKRLTLRLDLDGVPATLSADPVRFKQILLNLVSNAVKFTPDDGLITIAACRDQSRSEFVDIVVTDSGIGIKPDDLPQLFQEFVRLDAALVRHIPGTGLGLALTKRLVELHGGTISAASDGEGLGSTFTVRLSLAPSI